MMEKKSFDPKKLIELTLFFFLLINYAFFFPRWADWGQNSRLDLVLAIVDRGTLSIDAYYQNTGDYALYHGNHYMDKAPGPSLLAVPVYAIIRPVLHTAPVKGLIDRLANSQAFAGTLQAGGSGLQEDKIYQALVLLIVTFVVVTIPSAALGVLFYRFLGYLNPKLGWNVIAVLLYGLATSAFPYAGTFVSHQLTAFLLFGAFLLAYEIRQKIRSPRWATLVGLMLGYAMISEYPTALIAGAITLYIFLTLPERRWFAGLIAGGLICGSILMIYNWIIFKSILPVGYEYSALYTEQHSTGFLSLTYPHLDALWGITFSKFRGLFFLSPVLLLAAAGFVAWWQSRQLRGELWICLWSVVSFFLFNGSSVMWQGGYAVGPRYLVPMLPFFAMGWGGFALRWGDRFLARALMAILGLASFLAVWAETIGGQSFPDWSSNPLVSYTWPRLVEGDIARNMAMILNLRGWSSLIVLAVFWVIGLFILYRYVRKVEHGR